MSQALEFEQALTELEKIVERLQQPDVPLVQAMALYKRGTELARRADELLNKADMQIQQLTRAVRERFEEYSPAALEQETPPEA